MTGDVTGDVTGAVTGNVTGDVKHTDGSVLINMAAKSATFTGGVTADVTGNLTGVASNATLAAKITANSNDGSVSETLYLTMVDGLSNDRAVETHTALKYNPNTGVMTSSSFNGDVTGDLTGSVLQAAQTSITSVGTLTGLTVNGDATISDGANDFNIASHDGTNGLKLGGTLVTASAVELNRMKGITATTDELNKMNGVTSTKDELNLVDGSSSGTIVNGKAVVYGSAGEVNATKLQISGTDVNVTAAEFNCLIISFKHSNWLDNKHAKITSSTTLDSNDWFWISV